MKLSLRGGPRTRGFWLGVLIGSAGAAAAIGVTWLACSVLVRAFPPGSAEWVSAFGSIGAILGAAWVAGRQSREADRRDRARRAARLTHASRVIYVAYEEIQRAAANFDVAAKLSGQGADGQVGYATPETVAASIRATQRSLEQFPAELVDEVEVVRILYFARALLAGALGDVEGLSGRRLPAARDDFQRASAVLAGAADELLLRYRPVWPLAEPETAAAQAKVQEPSAVRPS